ncbi:MAG: type I secretion system permease/ATPase, partial [Snodgrassella sp.]|nr:type I secretion system permease/ATPase [Snodgrassella sp.]
KFDFLLCLFRQLLNNLIFLEVLLVLVVIQLFALITPLFFQVVMDKMLVHHGFSTLDVIAVAPLVVTLFDVVWRSLRIYIFAHIISSIDVELEA